MVFHKLDPQPMRQRVVLLPADPSRPIQSIDIDAGWQAYNATIAASWGDVVTVRLPSIVREADRFKVNADMWIDDEGMMRETPSLNARASALAGRVIAGDAMVMCTNRKGEASQMPAQVEAAIIAVLQADGDNAIGPRR
jgi:hypothetical protein